jgi:hypothetical protein
MNDKHFANCYQLEEKTAKRVPRTMIEKTLTQQQANEV